MLQSYKTKGNDKNRSYINLNSPCKTQVQHQNRDKKIRYTENPWLQIIKNEHKILKAKKITWY